MKKFANRNGEIRASERDPLARVIAPIVQGQIRSYLADHGDMLAKQDRGTIVHSLSKRIINDLLCAQARARMAAALGVSLEPTEAGARGVTSARAAGDAEVELASPANADQEEARAMT